METSSTAFRRTAAESEPAAAVPIECPSVLPLRPEVTVSLHSVFLHVTRACNQRCRYCYFSAGTPLPDEMTTREYQRLWPELVSLRPRKVVFTGGEPLLRQDLLDLLRDLREADPEHQVLRCINTNGRLVSPAMAREWVGLADEVAVSLDALAARNDALRGPGSFHTAIQALECLHAQGFEPKVLLTVTSVGLPDLEELLSALFARGLTCVHLNPLRLIGRAAAHREWLTSAAAVQIAFDRARRRWHPDRPRRVSSLQQARCDAGSYLNILPDGSVFPCHVLAAAQFCLGNVRKTSLRDICAPNGPLRRFGAIEFHGCQDGSGKVGRDALVDHPATQIGKD